MPKIVLNNWSAGLWTAGPACKAPTNTLTRCTNIEYMDEGAIRTRAGSTVLYTVPTTVDGLLISGSHYTKQASGEVYEGNTDTSISQPATQRLFAIGVPILGVPNDAVLFPGSMKKWHNGVATSWGIADVPTVPTASPGGSGDLSGQYTYRLVFYNATEKTKSAAGTASTEVTATSQQITLGALPTTTVDPQTTHIQVYRTAGGNPAVWYYVDQVALGVGAYVDTIADNGLGDVMDYNIIPPPACTIAGTYKGRVITAGVTDYDRYIYYSYASYPEYFNNIFLEVVLIAGDTLQAVLELGDYAILVGSRNTYTLQIPSDGVDYTAKLFGRGTINGRTIAMGNAGIYYVASDGVYVISGMSSPVKVSNQIDALFRGEDRGGLSTIADQTKCSATFTGGRYYFTYYGADAQYHTVMYNEPQNRWRHIVGWNWVCDPLSSASIRPVVGLPSVVGQSVSGALDDCGTAITSIAGFNLALLPTSLMEIRTWRASVYSTGTVTVSFYDRGILQYSLDLVAPDYATAYTKHSLPLPLYFDEPEVVFTSTDNFELHTFEADVNLVRKYEQDYTRSTGLDGTNAGSTASAG